MFTPPGGRRGSTSVLCGFLLLVVVTALDLPPEVAVVPLGFLPVVVVSESEEVVAAAVSEDDLEAGEAVVLESLVLESVVWSAVDFVSEPGLGAGISEGFALYGM